MTLRNISLAAGLVAAGLSFASSALAADGFAYRSGYLRAGPARDYPAVGRLGTGETLVVHGCLVRYSWCDVSASGERGWYPGSRIAFEREGRRVALPTVASVVGLSIVGFALSDYWGSHYRSRPWYEDRRWRRGPRDRPFVGEGPRRGSDKPVRGDVRAPRDRPGPDITLPPRDRSKTDARPPRDRPFKTDARPPRDRPNAPGVRTPPRDQPRADQKPSGGRPNPGADPKPCVENCR
jgi:uncharacterized protein YraI